MVELLWERFLRMNARASSQSRLSHLLQTLRGDLLFFAPTLFALH